MLGSGLRWILKKANRTLVVPRSSQIGSGLAPFVVIVNTCTKRKQYSAVAATKFRGEHQKRPLLAEACVYIGAGLSQKVNRGGIVPPGVQDKRERSVQLLLRILALTEKFRQSDHVAYRCGTHEIIEIMSMPARAHDCSRRAGWPTAGEDFNRSAHFAPREYPSPRIDQLTDPPGDQFQSVQVSDL